MNVGRFWRPSDCEELGGLSRKDEVVLKISKYFHPDRK